MKQRWFLSVMCAATLALCLAPGRLDGQILGGATTFLLQNLGLMRSLAEPQVDPLEFPPGNFKAVKPQEFDPGRTHLVQATWLHGIGCPTDARIAIPNATFTDVSGFAPYNDPACNDGGDPQDLRNEGLLLAKTGPTSNFAAATAELINVKGMVVTEVGYDIRKALLTASPAGSHCGAGAPRFNIVSTAGAVTFLGCATGTPVAASNGWIRLRWTLPIPITAQRIVIVMDEGQDIGPDFFGAAILDNISVNGVMVGRGATDAN